MHSLKSETARIPKIIWQTTKNTNNLHINAKKSIASFLQKNPNYQWYIMDDEQCRQFIQDHFSQEFYNMYISLPFGIMRADVWRIAIIYVYGGIYVDTDCNCIVPLDNWINPNDELIAFEEWSNCSYGNFVIIAEPKHPALLESLNIIMRTYNSNGFLNRNSPTPIQDFGAGAYYQGVKSFIENNVNHNIRVLKYHEHRITNSFHNSSYIVHDSASIKWNRYDSWRKQQQKHFGVFGG